MPLFHIAELHKIYTANSPSSFLGDALATKESGKVFTQKETYKNTKILHNFGVTNDMRNSQTGESESRKTQDFLQRAITPGDI